LEGRFQLIEVSLVLPLVLDLLADTLEDANGGGIVVDLAGGAECGVDDLGGGDEVVGEAVVEASLELEEVRDRVEEGVVTLVEGLEGLGLVGVGAALGGARAGVGKADWKHHVSGAEICARVAEETEQGGSEGEDGSLGTGRTREGSGPDDNGRTGCKRGTNEVPGDGGEHGAIGGGAVGDVRKRMLL
jgi:hypothetical protein